nr:efflux RND transporter permease subunit [Chryseobacterium sp. CCH4-E10]
MREGYNIVQYGKDVEVVMKEFERTLPDDVKMFRIADQPQVVNASINTFLEELAIAVAAVVLVVMFLLPVRVAGVAASTIPVSIFISLAIMYAFGIELNTVTLAALVVVLGMIVDNSIVIVDSYLEKLDEGIPRRTAAIESAREYFKAILSATLAIGITFFPFLFTLTGQMYDFVLAFPWTVLITLGISLAVAVLFVPYLQYMIITKGLHLGHSTAKKNRSFLDYVQFAYDKVLEKVFQFPKISFLTGILSVVIGAIMFINLPMKLMPVAERDQFAVEIYLPQASALEETEKVANDMSKMLGRDKRVRSITTFMGSGSPRFQTTYAPKIGGSNFAQFIVNTESNEATEEILDEYATKYAHHYPNAFVKFKQLDYQIGVDADVEIRLSGDNIADLKEIYAALEKALCLESVSEFSEGVRTIVGEGGSKLSGGQKQRISIARALLKDAPIVLLDEATASLDPENEIHIQQAIQELVKSKTVVVIAHKLTTIKNADQILVLNDGKIIESGNHNELLSKKGKYNVLWNMQQQSGGWRIVM